MKLDNFRLITEVGLRRALWDSTMQLSLRKDTCAVGWQEVADLMQMDVPACKKRYKGLRDSYRAEIRKIQNRRNVTSNWPYFRALEYLRDIFDPNKLVPFSPLPFNIDNDCPEYDQHKLDDFIIDVDNDDSFDFEIMGDIFKRESTEPQNHDSGSDMSGMGINKQHYDISASSLSMSFNRSDMETSPRLLSPIVAKRSRRRKTSSSTDVPYQNGYPTAAQSPPAATVPDTAAKDDPDYNFLVSLLPHVKSLSSMSNMRFRADVSRLLMDLNQQDLQPAPRETNNMGTPTMPKLVPAPTTNYDHHNEHDTTKYLMANTLNGNAFVAHSSIIECDVKIENEPLY